MVKIKILESSFNHLIHFTELLLCDRQQRYKIELFNKCAND